MARLLLVGVGLWGLRSTKQLGSLGYVQYNNADSSAI
jgi:hypothetical protein